MDSLLEYYESGNAPHEALGRAARRLSGGGALYLGGGIGIEKLKKGDAESFSVTKGSGKAETFPGPLSAVVRAFTLAGSSTGIDSPGGTTSIADPAAAARLRELKDEEAECERDIERFEARIARRKSAENSGRIPWSPVGSCASDDNWEARRVEELKSDLGRIRAERAKLTTTGKVEEAEAGKPGTNWTQVTPDAKKKLSGILKHYRGMAHPFTACVRDNTKRFGPEGAKRVCAVVKDLNERTTKWRKGSKAALKEADELIEAALGRLKVVEAEFGAPAMLQLAEGFESPLSAVNELGESVANDFALLAMAGHPLALTVFGIEESFDSEHPRDFLGRWKKKVGALKPGESLTMPNGTTVMRQNGGSGFVVDQTSINSKDPLKTAVNVAGEREQAKGSRKKNELGKSYDAGKARQAEVDRIKALSPGAGKAAAEHSPAKPTVAQRNADIDRMQAELAKAVSKGDTERARQLRLAIARKGAGNAPGARAAAR